MSWNPINMVIPFCERDIPKVYTCLESLAHFQWWEDDVQHIFLLSTHRLSQETDREVWSRVRDILPVAYGMFTRDMTQLHPGVAAWALLHAANINRDLARLVSQPPRPFLFCEPDVTFVRPDPLSMLAKEFYHGGKPVLGALTQTEGVGLYCNGVAVYGGEAVGDTACATLRPDELTACTNIPFDVALRHRVLPNLWITNLIEQVPATTNWDAPLPEKAVMVHGVKDDSLWKYVKGGGE